MAYTYADYESESTDALRLSRLRLHIAEVSADMGASISADGKSRNTQTLVDYLRMLKDRREDLERATGESSRGPRISLHDCR